jgi:hypothetical protein
MRANTKVMPPIFFPSENVIAKTLKFTWMIHTSFAVMRPFFHRMCYFQLTFANIKQDIVYQCCKIPCFDFGAHHKNFVSIHWYLQNGHHIVHNLQGQTGGSQKVPDLGCKQCEEEQSIPFL